MSAEVVMVVEYEDASGWAFAAIEVRGRKPADATTHDDQVVVLFDRTRSPCRAGDTGVHGFPGAIMAAAQAGLGGRVIVGAESEF